MSPLQLSICIPTYNRAARLSATLQSLLAQIEAEHLESAVEVCVSDNASTDETPSILDEIRGSSCINVVTVRLPEHQGYAHNCLNVVQAASGRYVALCGDDDPFLPGALRTLWEASQREVPVVLLNSHPSDVSIALPSVVRIEHPAHCVTVLGVFHASFIGNLLIQRDVFLRHFTHPLLRSAYPHYAIVMRALSTSPGFFINRATVSVDDRLRTWRAYEPVYSAIDMARLQTEEVLNGRATGRLIRAVYWELCRSLPRALLALRSKQIVSQSGNPYGDLALRNALACYRRAVEFQVLAFCLWMIGRLAPLTTLRAVLNWRQKSRVRIGRDRGAIPIQTSLIP